MRKLTDLQIDFIVYNFFRTERYVGWWELGRILVEQGKCVVGGTDIIWRGGIGNWIHVKPLENSIDCLLYEFNLANFTTSNWFISVQQEYLVTINKKRDQLSQEFTEIMALEDIK